MANQCRSRSKICHEVVEHLTCLGIEQTSFGMEIAMNDFVARECRQCQCDLEQMTT